MSSPQSPFSADVESAGIGLAGIVTFLLLVFALLFFIVYPTQETPSFSELKWAESPRLVPDGNGFAIVFRVEVHSSERETVSYHASVYLDDRFVAFRDVALAPSARMVLPFSLPAPAVDGSRREVQVSLSRKSPPEDGNAERPVFELVDWVVLEVE